MIAAFNSPLEIGTRSLVILTEVFPRALDLHHLVFFDYLSIHSGDVQGPQSLHTPLPLRSGELAVRQKLIERGLFLMMSRKLVERLVSAEGFQYTATDNTNAFLTMLNSRYIYMLKERASWVAEKFGHASLEELRVMERRFFQQTTVQFQTFERREGSNL